VSVAVTVVAPAEAGPVWSRLTDFGRWPEWNPHCIEARMTGPLAPGTPLDLHLRHPRGRDFYTRPRLSAVAAQERLAWTATALLLRATVTVTLGEEEDGTRVTLVSEATGRLALTYRMTMPDKTQALLYAGMLDALTDSFR
jgi:hypothetical protein